ncbi:chorismate mutase [Mediterraneibacter butyricigenes]|uniref:Bifunctional chorismate mutase/prephenate dehydratase n=1 Tax=Mediterraneibacter butyricigenes TaxID=2316025 RepID=A0A391P1H2_9FIRM|nr:prephenate dehydratase [Mediterraneibacter butyricigenes]RGO27960.1 prephenate dehydratase [Dorea sp. OM02-2LB]GCA65786.1 chorismate mutase [Mediterraneibacter butyricigenes]
MADLLELRDRIDEIDHEIARLYEARMGVCREVGEYKIANGSKVFDRQREKEKISAVKTMVHGEFNKKGIGELFEQLMAMSRKLQYQLLTEKGALGKLPFIAVEELDWKNSRIVFQGTEGSYSQEAMFRYFGKEINSFHVQKFRDAMEAIEEGSADFAVLPIENSTAGAVDEVFDLLVEFENYIVDELVLPVRHALAGLPDATLSDIERVYSHPQALMQSARYLDEHRDWQQISVANTAVAARKVLEDDDVKKAAICSEHAAEVYGLKLLDREINDNPANSTRFIIVTNQKIFRKNASKISICFEVSHESGSLYHMLSHFIYNDLNMTKIESRPIEGRPWEYRFFVDFDGNMADPAVKNAIRGLREESRNLKILGNY